MGVVLTHLLREGVGLNEEEPVPVGLCKVRAGLLVHVHGRGNVQQHDVAEQVGKVEAEAVGDSLRSAKGMVSHQSWALKCFSTTHSTAIVPYDGPPAVLLASQQLDRFHHIPAHLSLGVPLTHGLVCILAILLPLNWRGIAQAVSPQVGNDDAHGPWEQVGHT